MRNLREMLDNLYISRIPNREWYYFGPNVEAGLLGDKYICFGFWWFHVYYDTGDHI